MKRASRLLLLRFLAPHQKVSKNIGFYRVFGSSALQKSAKKEAAQKMGPKRPPRRFLGTKNGPKTRPRRAHDAPTTPQDAPRRPQDAPKRPQDAPKTPPGGPKAPPRGFPDPPDRPPAPSKLHFCVQKCPKHENAKHPGKTHGLGHFQDASKALFVR